MSEISQGVNGSYADPGLNETNLLVVFILWGVLLPLVAVFGVVGNVLTILVLWRREMNSTTILYLRGLVITDTGILIGSVVTLTPIA
ncbi:peptide receptor gpcr [Plakobranchus ocellatus]|uniref:Peptide receptor gpcr n=1 Tax=Plakobranchus ocellatus TaxID=259542 RepID=A0AAV4ATZ4_9GAST|nr:peptide receptor gpcr [Plakobranchus ocellatus]